VGTERKILKALVMDVMHLKDLRDCIFTTHLHTLTVTSRQLVQVLLCAFMAVKCIQMRVEIIDLLDSIIVCMYFSMFYLFNRLIDSSEQTPF
jgi:hypothetical protein